MLPAWAALLYREARAAFRAAITAGQGLQDSGSWLGRTQASRPSLCQMCVCGGGCTGCKGMIVKQSEPPVILQGYWTHRGR